ncbi:MAG: adenylate/guanylate cyclase domain-containing protein [bacterium]|nr:adenylate/guanylate cyclase domain-containing protein [bacterium]
MFYAAKDKQKIPEFTGALQKREYRIENRINKYRLIFMGLLAIMDIVVMAVSSVPFDPKYLPMSLVFSSLVIIYYLLINKVTKSSVYKEWLKYLISSIDFAMIHIAYFHVKEFDFLHSMITPQGISVIFILFCIIIIFISALRCGRVIIIYNTLLACVVSYFVVHDAFNSAILPLYVILFILMGGFLARWISSSITHLYIDLRKRQRLMRFLSKEIVNSIDSGSITLELGGEEKTVTVLFADIRGFTRLSENRKPEEVVSLLNFYFSEMMGVIHSYGGMIDKLIGDAVMAVFGVPEEKTNDAVMAVKAAVSMQEHIVHVNEKLAAQGYPAISIGIALHTGVVIAGNIGSSERMDYTVIGDTVNVTSRIEGLNKKYGTSILMSEATHSLVEGAVETRFLDETPIRGRKESIRVYTVPSP